MLCFVFNSGNTHAFGDYGFSGGQTWFLGLGLLSENMKQYSTESTDQNTSLENTVYTNLELSTRFAATDTWFVSPSIGYTPLGIKSPDGGETTRILNFQLRAETYFMDTLAFQIGPGLIHRSTSASGGSTQLSNGNGTSTFYFPPSGDSENYIDWDVGFGLKINSLGVRLDLDILINDLLSSSRRAADGLVTLSYGIF